jgi:uronate dehydrogenase
LDLHRALAAFPEVLGMALVLMTGATGQVARGVLPLLANHFDLRLLSLDPSAGDPQRIQADLLDREALARALDGVGAVLHLAVASGHSGLYEEDAFNDYRFDVNVKGTFHVLEAARRAGVRRIVNVSSLMVVWRYGSAGLVPGDAPPRPAGTYALTKTLAEQVARHYAEAYGLEVITLRIAAPLDISSPDLVGKPVRPQQVPFPDLAQAFALALTVPLTGYQVVTIVGDSSRRAWDLEPARRVLGYVPHYYLDDLGVTWADPFSEG